MRNFIVGMFSTKLTHMNRFKRRDFIKYSGLAAAGSLIPLTVLSKGFSHQGSKTLRVGLIGCGGRGTGAASQAVKADPNVVLYAAADIFEDKLVESIGNLKNAHGDKIQVDKSRQFVGFDAYERLLESDVDVVLLATPPNFRPLHMEAAIKAGKHVFSEKPVAVDAPGIRKVLEASELAKQKGLSIVSGFCFRYDTPKRELFRHVLDGAVGEITTVYNTRNTGALWTVPRQPGWTDQEAVLRNWYYYSWLSGDHIVEQAVHSVDMMSWVFGDKIPVAVEGTGGRQSRIDPFYGNIYDHFAIVYEYENNAKGFHFCRQQEGTASSNLVEIFGHNGRALMDQGKNIHEIYAKNTWKYQGKPSNMYQNQHDELFASIRSGKAINDGESMSRSTLLAIMGRMVAYTGQRITYEQALQSEETLGILPENCSFDMKLPDVEIAKPGITKFI